MEETASLYNTVASTTELAEVVEATNKKVNKLTNLHGAYKDVIISEAKELV